MIEEGFDEQVEGRPFDVMGSIDMPLVYDTDGTNDRIEGIDLVVTHLNDGNAKNGRANKDNDLIEDIIYS